MEGGEVKEGYTIFAAYPSDEKAIASAKEYIRKNKLTGDDVKLGRQGETVVVVTKREIILQS